MKWKLAACRINKGLKQKDVAELMHISVKVLKGLHHQDTYGLQLFCSFTCPFHQFLIPALSPVSAFIPDLFTDDSGLLIQKIPAFSQIFCQIIHTAAKCN